ncbi:MAG: hypothetical protein WBM99_16735 [Psychromonas sp.]
MNKLNYNTIDSLKTIKQLDYLFHVLNNMDEHPDTVVFFGETGEGHAPNYLVVTSDGSENVHRGDNHGVFGRTETFNKKNISSKGFTSDEIKDAFDQQEKSPKVAKQIMSKYWKLNKVNYEVKPADMPQYRDKIILLSSAGTPISMAFELIMRA